MSAHLMLISTMETKIFMIIIIHNCLHFPSLLNIILNKPLTHRCSIHHCLILAQITCSFSLPSLLPFFLHFLLKATFSGDSDGHDENQILLFFGPMLYPLHNMQRKRSSNPYLKTTHDRKQKKVLFFISSLIHYSFILLL